MKTEIIVGLNAVIVAVTREVPRILTVQWVPQLPLPKVDRLGLASGADVSASAGSGVASGPDVSAAAGSGVATEPDLTPPAGPGAFAEPEASPASGSSTLAKPDVSAAGGSDAAGPDQPLAALPFGPLDPVADRKLERAVLRWVRGQTGLELGFVEQLYTFGDQYRNPVDLHGASRSVSVAYVALARESRTTGALVAAWRDIYLFFPWEDWRDGRPAVIERQIAPALESWAAAAPDRAAVRARRERAEIAFGLGEAGWDGDRVLERYELLYELGLVAETWRDRAYRIAAGVEPKGDILDGVAPWSGAPTSIDPASVAPTGGGPGSRTPIGSTARSHSPIRGTRNLGAPSARAGLSDSHLLGRPMALDHRRIVASALGRLRGKIKYRPVVFELLPPTFTLLQLQRVVEALAGVRLHKGNFRRLVEKGGLVESTGRLDPSTGGRPAGLFRFRREVLRERKTPGVGLPGLPRGESTASD